MQLSKKNLASITTPGLQRPTPELFDLPEKVLQFGTGVLLRGLPDYFIDKANRQGIFNGRIAVVKSTDVGDTSAFDQQDGLYTLCIRGIEDGKKVEENIICSAVSRVLSARDQWAEILKLAHHPEMQIIISNTTEVGIQLVEDNIRASPPVSFPGKLLAFLFERYQAFKGNPISGMVIVPTELIVDNGKKLSAIVEELARINKVETGFLLWLERHCMFCNSLVDRIVPGKPDAAAYEQLQKELGYEDQLLAVSEVYRLWAIEGTGRAPSILSFAKADPGVIIKGDIEIYRELKLRLLNGTHTLSCGLAFLAGFGNVKNAMDNAGFSVFASDLMMNEIARSIPYKVDPKDATQFGLQVLDRFRNPHLQHQWISITMQYSSKMKMRAIPVLLQHYRRDRNPPPLFALGFAAYLLFMRATKKDGDTYMGESAKKSYPIKDDKAELYFEWWKQKSAAVVVNKSLSNTDLWGTDLTQLEGFEAAVLENLERLLKEGPKATLAAATTKLTGV